MATSVEDHVVSIPMDDLAEGRTRQRSTSNTSREGDVEVGQNNQIEQGEDVHGGGEQPPNPRPSGDAGHNLYGIFAGDRTDLTLLGGYNSIIIFLDAGSDPANPTQCSGAQTVCSWIVFGVVMVIYAGRHSRGLKQAVYRCMGKWTTITGDDEANKTSHSGFRWWFYPLRAVVFGGFLLCMHNQPISCSIAKDRLKDLRFAHATAIVLMSMVANVTFGNSLHYQADQKRPVAAHANVNNANGNSRPAQVRDRWPFICLGLSPWWAWRVFVENVQTNWKKYTLTAPDLKTNRNLKTRSQNRRAAHT